jgi:acetolactate synthase-1/2/3 large subunit
MMKMTGGQALAQQLAREGVTDVFGVPGLQLDWALDGLRQVQNRIRFTVTRHEQAASYMADGYARTTDRLGACMVVPGPGLLNAMSGLATAYACSSPVLCISGNIHSGGIGKGRGLLHEINNQSGVLAVVTKWQGTASSPREIPAVVREAAKQMRSGRPRPAGIEIAHDVLAASDEVELIDPPADEDGRLVPQPREIDEAVAALAAARLPVIYAGGGVIASRASEALARLADRLQAPVVMSDHGRGGLPDTHPLALNTLGGRAVFPHADVVLAVGTRFVDINQGNPVWSGGGKRYVFLNVSPEDWAPPRAPGLTIHADARLGLEALADALPKRAAASRAGGVGRAQRRIRFVGDAVEIEDRIEGAAAGSVVRWAMCTEAAVGLDGRVALLTQQGKRLRMQFAGGDMHLQVLDISAPRADIDAPNPNTRQVIASSPVAADGTWSMSVRLAR